MAFVVSFNSSLIRSVNHSNVSPRRRGTSSNVCVPRMGIRAVESYDGSFTLSNDVESVLNELLLDTKFCAYVANQAKRESAEYLGLLFQPVPYSVSTRHGMPREFEKYYKDENFAICNVPPQYMFKAKCYKPSRLCAVYQLSGAQVNVDDQAMNDTEWSNIGDAFRNPVKDGDDKVEKDLMV